MNKAQIRAAEAGADAATIAALATTPDDATITATVTVPAATVPAVVVPTTTAPVDAATQALPVVTVPNTPATAFVENTAPTVLASVHEGVVSALNAQMATVNATLAAAQAEVQTLKASVASTEALTTIVRQVLGNKIVALGGSASTADTFNSTNIAAEYSRVDALFKDKFKAGGVAATASPVPVETTPQKASPVDAAIQQFTIPS
jgi:hypothetical protein